MKNLSLSLVKVMSCAGLLGFTPIIFASAPPPPGGYQYITANLEFTNGSTDSFLIGDSSGTGDAHLNSATPISNGDQPCDTSSPGKCYLLLPGRTYKVSYVWHLEGSSSNGISVTTFFTNTATNVPTAKYNFYTTDNGSDTGQAHPCDSSQNGILSGSYYLSCEPIQNDSFNVQVRIEKK